MLGQTLSHYRIISQLGVGGMGVVYEGVDPRLGRPVAIKFVPEEFANDLKALERLRSEARTASGLNHPNICTIYDVGEHEGRPFIVMELLKGQTLRDRIATKPLKMHEAIDVGIQVADALDCAHGQHIIHRDIKPANLFVVDRGQIKVLDFGLAKLVNRELGTQMTLAPTIDQTAAGVAMGTVAYMSPEQVQGEDLDGRTDLFALGVVLYECVTGHQPFKGKTSAVVFSQILTQAPTAPVALNPDVPARLQDVINNCLEKDRELRYQEAAGLRADLRRVKRDLESGASAVARTGAVTVSLSGVGARQSSGARTTTSVPIGDSAQTRAVSAGSATSSGRLPWLGVGLVVAAFVVGAGFYLSRGRAPESPPASSQPVAVSPSSVSPAAPAPGVAAAPAADAAVPAPPAADTATANARLESAIAEAARLRAEVEAERRLAAAERARAAADTRTAATPGAVAPAPPPSAVTSAAPPPRALSSTPEPPPAALPPTAAAAAPVPVARPTEPAPAPPPAPRADPAPERRPAAPAAEDDESAIRRVVANYARAIESKSLALFREVKPNVTPDEQRRLEDGFRAVSSQRVTITVDAIEKRGQEAVVRLRRHDVIQAGGRQQTADSQQTMTFTHVNGTWVIREIGR